MRRVVVEWGLRLMNWIKNKKCKACRNGTKYKGYYWAKEWVKTFEAEEDD